MDKYCSKVVSIGTESIWLQQWPGVPQSLRALLRKKERGGWQCEED